MLSTILLLINSCGNSSSNSTSDNNSSDIIQSLSQEEESLRIIRRYSISVNNPIPTVDDYKNAGVIGVDDNNIEDINYIISYLDIKQIDTKEQITTFVDNFSKPNITPLANAGDDLKATQGSIIKLNGSNSADGDGAIVSYNWSLDDTSLATDVVLILSDLKKGIYTIVLTITDNKGAKSTDEVIITIEESYNNPPVADAGDDINATIGDNIILDAINSSDSDGQIISYEWSENGILLSDKISFANNIYPIGTHNITLTVKDNSGGISVDNMILTVIEKDLEEEYLHYEDNITEILNQPPVITMIENLTAELNQSTLITASVTDIDGRVVSYQWKKGEEILSDTITFHCTPTIVGTDILTLTVIDDDGAIASKSLSINVIDIVPNIPPSVNAGFSQNTEVNSSVEIIGEAIDSDGIITDYKWERDGTTLAQTKDFTYLPVVIGTHTLILTVTDDDGATASDSVDIIVSEPQNQNPIANAGEDITVSSAIGMIGLDGSLSSDIDGVITSYQWLKDGKEIATGKIAELDITDYFAGIYDISLIVTDDDGATHSDILQLTIYNTPISKVIRTGQIASYGNYDDGALQKGVTAIYTRSIDNLIVIDETRNNMWQDDNDPNAEGTYTYAQSYCDTLILGGYLDWKLPTIHDLVNIINQENSPVHVDFQFFNTQLASYWSTATVVNDTNKMWFVDFYEGMTGNTSKEELLKIKCIRDN